MPTSFLHGRRARRFEALQGCLVPPARQFTDDQKKQSRQIINRVLQSQPASQQNKLKLFLILIELTSIMRTGKRFHALPYEKQERVLLIFFDAPIGILRKGFWGLNTLAKMGVYGQSSVYPEICYRIRKVPVPGLESMSEVGKTEIMAVLKNYRSC